MQAEIDQQEIEVSTKLHIVCTAETYVYEMLCNPLNVKKKQVTWKMLQSFKYL